MMMTTGGYVPRPGDPCLATVQPGELIVPGWAVLDGSAARVIEALQGGDDA